MIIAVDFDGTCVTHEYPEIGQDIGAVPVLKALVARGDQLILYTMRHGKTLTAAIEWFTENGIELWAANVNPEQHTWSESRKVYAHIYIDDAALGVPLMIPVGAGRSFVDWARVATMMGVDLTKGATP